MQLHQCPDPDTDFHDLDLGEADMCHLDFVSRGQADMCCPALVISCSPAGLVSEYPA